MDSNRIPNSLRLYRRRKRLKQRDVARLLGVKNASMISRWEQGLVIPDRDNLMDLSHIYCTSSDALLSEYRAMRGEIIQKRKEELNINFRKT